MKDSKLLSTFFLIASALQIIVYCQHDTFKVFLKGLHFKSDKSMPIDGNGYFSPAYNFWIPRYIGKVGGTTIFREYFEHIFCNFFLRNYTGTLHKKRLFGGVTTATECLPLLSEWGILTNGTNITLADIRILKTAVLYFVRNPCDYRCQGHLISG